MSFQQSEYRLWALWWTTLKETWRRFLYGPSKRDPGAFVFRVVEMGPATVRLTKEDFNCAIGVALRIGAQRWGFRFDRETLRLYDGSYPDLSIEDSDEQAQG